MQISAVSNQGFTGKRTNIDNVIAQDDNVVRQIAIDSAIKSSNQERHKKINNALWYSIPLVAGLSAAILNKGKTTLFTKEITGVAAKLTSGLKHAAGWALALGTVDTIIAGKKLLTKKSETAENFERKHGFTTFALTFGAGLAAMRYVPKALSKLYSKINPKIIGKLAESTGKIADRINDNKKIKSMNEFFARIGKKVPSVVKESGKIAVSFAPDALLAGTLLNSLAYGFKTANSANANYNYLKDTQLNLAKSRINELKIENDFLKQFPENKENLELLENPNKDLPQEVLDKIAEQNEAVEA